MNRYLIAALYVMAGCAVTIPLKAQGCGESLRGERCRLIITNTVKVVSVYLEEEEEEQVFCSGLPPDYFQIPVVEALADDFTFDKTVRVNIGSLPIRSGLLRFNLQIIIKIYEGSLSRINERKFNFLKG